MLFPRYTGTGRSSELLWRELDFETVLRTLHNPRYAGVYFYGRTRQRRLPNGRYLTKLKPMAEWDVVIPDAHEGYISQQQFEDNQRQLKANAFACGVDRRRGPAREGPALLQGLVICGRCGRRMTISYKWRQKKLLPVYYCQRKGEPSCQTVHGGVVDELVSERIVELVSPLTIEASLKVQEELEKRCKETDDHRLRQLEQMRYEADQARKRYLAVDPDNRLVAAQLEAEWNRTVSARRRSIRVRPPARGDKDPTLRRREGSGTRPCKERLFTCFSPSPSRVVRASGRRSQAPGRGVSAAGLEYRSAHYAPRRLLTDEHEEVVLCEAAAQDADPRARRAKSSATTA